MPPLKLPGHWRVQDFFSVSRLATLFVAPFQKVLEAKGSGFLQAEQLYSHTQRELLAFLLQLDTRSQFLDWINYRDKECVGTVINMFLYQRGRVHFYNLAAGLFYLQDRGNII